MGKFIAITVLSIIIIRLHKNCLCVFLLDGRSFSGKAPSRFLRYMPRTASGESACRCVFCSHKACRERKDCTDKPGPVPALLLCVPSRVTLLPDKMYRVQVWNEQPREKVLFAANCLALRAEHFGMPPKRRTLHTKCRLCDLSRYFLCPFPGPGIPLNLCHFSAKKGSNIHGSTGNFQTPRRLCGAKP